MEIRRWSENLENNSGQETARYLEEKPLLNDASLTKEDRKYLDNQCSNLFDENWKDKVPSKYKKQPLALQFLLGVPTDGFFGENSWKALKLRLSQRETYELATEISKKAGAKRFSLSNEGAEKVREADAEKSKEKAGFLSRIRENMLFELNLGTEFTNGLENETRVLGCADYMKSFDSYLKNNQLGKFINHLGEYEIYTINGSIREGRYPKEIQIVRELSYFLYEIADYNYDSTSKTASDKSVEDLWNAFRVSYFNEKEIPIAVCGGIHEFGAFALNQRGFEAGTATVRTPNGHIVTIGRLPKSKEVFIIDYGQIYIGGNMKEVFEKYEREKGTIALHHYISDHEGNIIGYMRTPAGEFLKDKFYAPESFMEFLDGKEKPKSGIQLFAKNRDGDFVSGVEARKVFKSLSLSTEAGQGVAGKSSVSQKVYYMTVGVDWLKDWFKAGVKGGTAKADTGDLFYNIAAYARARKEIEVGEKTKIAGGIGIEMGQKQMKGGKATTELTEANAGIKVRQELPKSSYIEVAGRLEATPGGIMKKRDYMQGYWNNIFTKVPSLKTTAAAKLGHDFKDDGKLELSGKYSEDKLAQGYGGELKYQRPGGWKGRVYGEKEEGKHFAYPDAERYGGSIELPTGIKIKGHEVLFETKGEYEKEQGRDDYWETGGFFKVRF